MAIDSVPHPSPTHEALRLHRYGEQPLWSTFRFGPGALAHFVGRLFTARLGEQAQGHPGALTLAETNMREGGRPCADYHVDRVCWSLWGEVPDEVEALWHNAAWAWDFQQTQIDGDPLDALDPEALVTLATIDAPARDMLFDRPGHHVRIGATLYQKVPIFLPHTAYFSVPLIVGGQMPPITRPIFVRMILRGTFTQAI